MLVVRAAPFALLTNSRKTERGAKRFPGMLVVRAAPFALSKSPTTKARVSFLDRNEVHPRLCGLTRLVSLAAIPQSPAHD
jgi:hypothetical protein